MRVFDYVQVWEKTRSPFSVHGKNEENPGCFGCIGVCSIPPVIGFIISQL